ncbi:tumor necrosis factor ligand superfamily member 9 [Pleurodeles waltl]|uniref:tumor necrosis factor ligand superfamily member 9 n=1 Tax=Pleurodeles waltl TaxID=8319 RepID=UPI003709B9D6
MTAETPTHVQIPMSLEPSSASRIRKLDICIFVSIALLAAALVGCGVLYLLMGHHRPCHHHHEGAPEGSAHLVAERVSLVDGEVAWLSDAHSGGHLYGMDFKYHEKDHQLQVNKRGVYYIYAQLAVRCVHACDKEGNITMFIYHNHDGNQESSILTLALSLPATSSPQKLPVQYRFSATTVKLSENDSLVAILKVNAPENQWQLDHPSNNFIGLFPTSRWVSPNL